MNLTQKPFVCYHKGCEMTFTNVDHLHVHKKKHKMALHLGIDNQNSNLGADQTPTPTRFIRNCEEVGLFQDLQNVNPFEETFRKATELVKSGSLHLPKEATDDTLHTPHFSPSIDDKIVSNYNKCCEKSPLGEKKTADITAVAAKEDHTTKSINKTQFMNANELVAKKFEDKQMACINSTDSCKTNSNIQELRKTVMDTLKLKLQHSISVNENVKATATDSNRNKCPAKSKVDRNGSVNKTKLDRTREINRYAQFRSRQKKKSWILQMERDIDELKRSKLELGVENQNLKNEVTLLKSMLLYHQDCSASKNPKIIEKVNTLLKKSQESVINSPKIKFTTVKQSTPLQPKVATITLIPNAIFVPVSVNSVNGTTQKQQSTYLKSNIISSSTKCAPLTEERGGDNTKRPASVDSNDSLEILIIDDE